MPGDTLRLTVTAKDSGGHLLSDRVVTWSSADTTIARVNSSGLLSAVAEGQVNVGALVEGIAGTAAVSVFEVHISGVWDWTEHVAGGGLVCDDTGSYAFQPSGHAFTGRSDQIGICSQGAGSTSNDAFGVPIHSGIVSRTQVTFELGSCTYAATAYGGSSPDSLSGTLVCGGSSGTWHAAPATPVTDLRLSADSMHVVIGWPRMPLLVMRNASGSRVFRPATWSSTDPVIASLDSTGLVAGLSNGTAQLAAAFDGLSDTVVAIVSSLRLAFLSRHGGTAQVYTMNSDGSDLQQLTHLSDGDIDTTAFVTHNRLAWSPDATKLALTSPGIRIVDAVSGDAVLLVSNGFDPAWSADGSRIRFLATGDSLIPVYEMHADGSDTTFVALADFEKPTTLSDSGAGSSAFSWSPDLTQVAYQRQSTHFFTTVYIANADGSGIHHATQSNVAEGGASWSPDGTSIALLDCFYGIVIINSDGSGQMKSISNFNCFASGNPGVFQRLTWSPDGEYLAFMRNLTGMAEIWVTDVTGATPPRRISPEGYDAWALATWRRSSP